MRFVSWNVNGLRAIVKKGFEDIFHELSADIFAIQESKLQAGQIDLQFEGYYQYWNYAVKKGYSGTAVFTRKEPEDVFYGLGLPEHDDEGRVITLKYPSFYFITVYTPNSQNALKRLPYRSTWDDAFREYVSRLDQDRPVVICGDLNVAHQEIDLAKPERNPQVAGFSDVERQNLGSLLDAGFIDTFRYFYPDTADRYTWWSYQSRARERNQGWRIDYFVVSERLAPYLIDAKIHETIMGSDHCPVELEMKDVLD